MRIFPELTVTSEVSKRKVGLWKRQFQPQRTNAQLTFDLVFGIVGPILCFVFDPIVFQSGFAGPPLLPEYQTFVYLFSGIEIMLLCFWLVMGRGPEFSNAMVGGGLFVGGLFCVGVGLVLMPYSLMGLMFGIGLFGFTPFLTAIVYARNGWRALNANVIKTVTFDRALGVVCGLLIVTSISIALAIQIRSVVATAVDQIVLGDAVHASHAVQRLAVLGFIASVDLDRIVVAYTAEVDENRKEILRSSYRQITGQDIERRARINQD